MTLLEGIENGIDRAIVVISSPRYLKFHIN